MIFILKLSGKSTKNSKINMFVENFIDICVYFVTLRLIFVDN